MMELPKSAACKLLECSIAIVLAGMGGVARSELVAAVTAAGGFGFLGMVREPVALIEKEVGRLHALGHTRFGVNLIPAATAPDLLEQQISTCIALKIPVVATFWDLDEAVVTRLRAAGIVVVHQVGSVDEAISAERAGVGIIIAQGCQAGGHVRGTQPLHSLLPEVVDAVNIPVLAAGGLASGADLVSAMALGAQGIVLGTALMATEEAFAHPYHKQRLLAAQASDTVLTERFHINWPIGAPVRVLKSDVTSGARGDVASTGRVVIGEEEGRPVYLFSTDSPLRSMTGEFADMALYAGTGIGQITEIPPAKARLAAIMDEAIGLLAPSSTRLETSYSSPACLAHEIGGAYMGYLNADELRVLLERLAADLHALLKAILAQDGLDIANAPPFDPATLPYAVWQLQIAALTGDAPKRTASTPEDPAYFQAQVLDRLSRLLPSIPEGFTRRLLVQLAAFLRSTPAQKLNALPEPSLSI